MHKNSNTKSKNITKSLTKGIEIQRYEGNGQVVEEKK